MLVLKHTHSIGLFV